MVTVLLAHADGEEMRAEEIAGPLSAAGYQVWHHGEVVVGDSITAEASRLLTEGGPVVVCGTVRAMGTRMPSVLANAARLRESSPRVFVVHMDREANIDTVAFGAKIAAYWADPERATQELLAALNKNYPLKQKRESFVGVPIASLRVIRQKLPDGTVIDTVEFVDPELAWKWLRKEFSQKDGGEGADE